MTADRWRAKLRNGVAALVYESSSNAQIHSRKCIAQRLARIRWCRAGFSEGEGAIPTNLSLEGRSANRLFGDVYLAAENFG